MASYSIAAPNGKTYDIEGPEGATKEQLVQVLMAKNPEANTPIKQADPSLLGEAYKGLQQYASQSRTALGGGSAESALAGLERGKAIDAERKSGVDLEKIKDLWNAGNYGSSALEYVKQAPYAIAGQIPQLATAAGGASLGARLGALGGLPGSLAGAGIGALAGQALSSYLPIAGSNIESQAAEQQKQGLPVDINRLAAYGTAVPQVGLEVISQRLLLGNKMLGKAFGFTEEQLAKKSVAELEKLAAEKLYATVGKGVLKGGLAEIPTEVTQTMLERAQAGLSITDAEARTAYGDTALQVGMIAPLGGYTRYRERGSAQQYQEKQAQAESAKKFQADQVAETARLQSPAYLEQLSTDYKAAVAEKKRLDEVATAAKEAAKSGDPSARATAAEALKAARKYEAETLTPLAKQHAPRSAEIQKLAETKRVAGMSPFDYMMEQSGVPTQEAQATAPPQEQQLYPGDEPEIRPVPAHETYAARQIRKAINGELPAANLIGKDFGTSEESDYVTYLMEDPAMARELVNNNTPIPGLSKKQSNAVLGGLKLQFAEQDKAQAKQEAERAKAEMAQRGADLTGARTTEEADPLAMWKASMEADQAVREGPNLTNLDYLNDLAGEALGKGSGEVAVEPPAGVQPSAKAPDVLGRIDALTKQRDQAAKDADLNFRSGNSTAGREALAKQKTADDALALAQSEDAAPYVQELVGQRNTQQTSLLDLESAVDDLINGRYLNKLDVGVSASRQIGLASSTKQGLLDKIKAAKTAYINSVLLESATKRRALGKENLSTDEALRAASDIAATLNEWVTRGLANPRHAALQEQVVQQAQMRGNKLVRGAITKMVEPTDTRPPEERRFGAYRQAVEVLKEQLEGARNKLFAVPERGVREQPFMRTQFAAEEAAKTGAERGEGAATLGGELRRRREAAADKVSKALARPDVPEDIRAALDSALTALEQGRGSKDVTSAEPTQQFTPGLIDAAEELATRILEGRVTPAGATASTGDVRRVEALEDTIDKLMAVQRNAKGEDAQAAAADKVKRVKAMLVTLKAKQPAAAAPTTTGAAERSLIGQINEALRGQGLTEEPAEQMSLFGPEAQQAPERMRRTLPARIEEERGKKTTSFQELGEQRTRLKALEGQLSSAEEAAEQARGLRAVQDKLDRGLGFIRKTAENFAKAPAVQRARMLVQQARDLTAKIKAEFDKRDAVQTRLLAHRKEVQKNLDILAAKLSHFDWVGTAFGETGVEPYTPTAPSKPIDTASDAVKAQYEKKLAQYPKDVAFAKEFNAFWAKEAVERKVYREYFNNQKKALLAEQGKLVNFLRPLSDSVADDVKSQIDAKEKTVEALRKQLAGRNNLDEFRTLTTQLNTFSADLAKLKKRLETPAVATGKAATAELNSFLQTQRSHLYAAYNQALDKARGDLTATRRAAAAPTIAAAEARIAETETELAALVAELNKKVTEYAAEQQETYGQTETTSAQQELSKSVAALETSVAAAQATAQENIDKAKAEIAKARETSEATVLMEEISTTALADRAVDTQRKALAKAVKQLEDLGFEVNLDRATVKLANKTDPIAQAQLATKVAELKRAEAAQASVRAERQAAEQRLKVGATQGLGLPGTRTVTNENAVAVKERFERAIVRLEADLAKAIEDREAAKTRQQKAGFTKRITSLKNEIAGNQAQMALVKTSRTETILEEKEAAADQQLADATTQAQYTAEAQARNAKNEQDIERLSKYIPVLETELARLEAQGVLAGKAGDAQRARIAQIKKRITDLNFTLEARLDTRIKHRKQRPVVVKTGVSNEPLRGGAYTKTVEEQRNPGESYEEARQRYDRTAAMLAAVAEADRIRGYPVGAKLTPEQKAKFDKARENALAAGKQQRLQDEKDAKKAAKEDEALERELIGRGGVDEFLRENNVKYDAPPETPLGTEGLAAVKAGDLQGVLDSIIENSPSPWLRELVKKLKPFAQGIKLRTQDALQSRGSPAAGLYNSTKNAIALDNDHLDEETVVHETVHAVTLRILKTPDAQLSAEQREAKRDILALFEEVKNNPALNREYGNVSVEEFVSEALSNNNLRTKLAGIESKTGTLTLWQKIKQALLRMFGIEKTVSALERADIVVERLFAPASAFTHGPNWIANTHVYASLIRPAAPTYAPNLKEAGELAERMVGRQKTTTQKIKANLAGLAFRTQFVDALAPLEKIAFGAMDALKGMQMMYYLRAYGQRMNYTSKAMSQGVPQLVEVKRADGRTEWKIAAGDGATLKDVVDILTTVKGVSPDAANRLFTLYMSAIRAKRVGIDALNFSGNITEADLDAAMQQIKAAGLEEPFERARSKYNEYNEDLLKFNIQTGYISKALGAELTAQKDYIPFYRVRNGNVELLIGKETPVRIGDLKSNPHLKELVGGEEPIFDFLTSSVQNTSMLMDAALRNMAVKNAMFELNEIKVNGENAVRISKGQGSKGTVAFFLEGEEHYAVVNTEETLGIPSDLLVRGLEGIPTMLPTAVRLMGLPARFLRRTIVASPVYMARQLFRDSLAATMTSGVDGLPVLNALRQIGKSHPLDKSGVTGGQVFTGTSEDMSRLLAEMQSGKSGWTQALTKLEAMSMEVDAAGRRAQYNSYIQQGLSEMEAEYMALDSMNFSKRGISPSMHYLSTLIPFFNAQIQGLDVLYKAFTGKMPMNEKLKIQEKLLARGAMLAGMTFAYAAAMQDDEGYKNATPEQKYGNWFVYVPGVKEAVRVPIPFEMGYVFKAIPEAIVNMAMKKHGVEEAKQAFKQIALQIIPGGTSWGMPQAIKPLIEVGLGKSFYTGQDLETAKEQRLDPWMRYRDNTSEAAKFVGQMTNISPVKMEALINGYTGSMGLALLQALNFAMPATGPEAAFKRLSEQPIIGPLFQPTDAGGIINATYDRMEEINRAKASYEKLIAEHHPAQAQAYLKEHITELSLASVAGSFSKQMGELTKYEAEIKASSRTPEKKREELDRIRQLKIKFATSVRAAFDRKELQAVPA